MTLVQQWKEIADLQRICSNTLRVRSVGSLYSPDTCSRFSTCQRTAFLLSC